MIHPTLPCLALALVVGGCGPKPICPYDPPQGKLDIVEECRKPDRQQPVRIHEDGETVPTPRPRPREYPDLDPPGRDRDHLPDLGDDDSDPPGRDRDRGDDVEQDRGKGRDHRHGNPGNYKSVGKAGETPDGKGGWGRGDRGRGR